MVIEAVCGTLLGAVAGLLYFQGLWWTVQRVPLSPRPQVLLFGSFLVRTLALLAGATGLALWSPIALIAASAGFWFGRGLVVSRHPVAAR